MYQVKLKISQAMKLQLKLTINITKFILGQDNTFNIGKPRVYHDCPNTFAMETDYQTKEPFNIVYKMGLHGG